MPRKINIERLPDWETLPEKKTKGSIKEHLQERFPDQLNFSIKQTAQILNISEDFIRDRIANKLIQVIKFGRYYQINIVELIRLLEEGMA